MKFQNITLVLVLMISLAQSYDSQSDFYIGCFRDSSRGRDLPHYQGNGYTIQQCRDKCGDQDYKYAGLQDRGKCYCGDDYGKYQIACEDYCNTPCTNNPNQICGGRLKNSIYHSNLCKDIGNTCLTEIEIQRCHDHLGGLDVDSISNECITYVEDDKVFYRFELSYHNGYKLDQSCLSQIVKVEGQEIPGLLYEDEMFFDGDIAYEKLPINKFSYMDEKDQLFFSVSHDDIDSLYGCEKFVNDDSYVWQCHFSLSIYFAGEIQFQYNFCMHVTMNRYKTNELNVTVNPNEVIGECCENYLEVETVLRFCEDFTCHKYLDDGLEVQRQQDIFVEHSIVSEEFKYYYLEGRQLKIGNFIPMIEKTDDSQPGKIIYQFQSNVALPDMVIEAISRIRETPQRRRFLNSNDNNNVITEEDDYKIKALNAISITDKQDIEIKKDDSQEQKQMIIVICVIISGVMCLGMIVGATVCCIRKQRKNKEQQQQKNEESNKASQYIVENTKRLPTQTNTSNDNCLSAK